MLKQLKFISVIILGLCITTNLAYAKKSPAKMVRKAIDLYRHQGRPLLADGMILGALELYKERNDQRGIANAYLNYGEFLRSEAVEEHIGYYTKKGFWDKSVTYETRLDKADEYFKLAIDQYKIAELESQENNQYDILTNIYFNLAWLNFRIDEVQKACEYYMNTREFHHKNIQFNPDENQNFSPEFKSVLDTVMYYEKQLGCSNGMNK